MDNPKPTKTTARWFLKAYRGLKKQGFVQSRNGSASCQYRGLGSLKCAVGFLLTDKAGRAFDNCMVQPGDGVFRIEGRKPSPPQVDFLCELQGAHDDKGTPASMKRRLLQVANKYSIKVKNP